MATILNTNGYFTSGDVKDWDWERVEWVIYPVVMLSAIISIGYMFELCGRKLSLNNPGTRVKTLGRTYKRRDSKYKKQARAGNGPEYRYEIKDQVVYYYDENDEYYPYNRLYLHLTFHVVALGMCLHFCHGRILVIMAWIHFFFFLIYIWFEVSLSLFQRLTFIRLPTISWPSG